MPATNLRKFSTTYYKDKVAGTDVAQIPAGSATVNVYKQGVTATSGGTVTTGGITLSVRSVNGLVAGDTVQRGTTAADQMTVDSIVSETSITIHSTTGSSIVVAAGERLVPYSARPTLYTEPTGVDTTANPTTTNASGYVKFYLTNRVFDVIISGTGLTATLYIDEESGLLVPRRNHYNVKDFASVALALSSIPDAAKLYFPAEEGPYTPPDANGWTLSKPVEIYSDFGAGTNSGFKYFGSPSSHGNSTVFKLAANNIYLHDFAIHNNSVPLTSIGTGDGISYTSATPLVRLVIERVSIENAGRNCLRFGGAASALNVTIRDCRFLAAAGAGIHADSVIVLVMSNTVCNNNRLSGLRLIQGGQFTISSCDFTGNGVDMATATTDAQVVLQTCTDGLINSCNVEDFSGMTVKNGILLNGCKALTLASNQINNNSDVAGTKAILLRNSTKGCSILSNFHYKVENAVETESAANEIGNFIAPQYLDNVSATVPGKVVIPTGSRNFVMFNNLTAGVADNKGVGILFPSMPGQANVDTSVIQDGLLIYDSTALAFIGRENGAWVNL